MLQLFTDAWAAKEKEIKAALLAEATSAGRYDGRPSRGADDLLSFALLHMFGAGERYSGGDRPDPARITTADFGAYQGTLVLVVGASGYQPSTHWATSLSYGSCSYCDALQSAHDEDDPETWAQDHMRIILTMIQGMVEIP